MVFRVKKEHNEDAFYDIYDGMLYKNDGHFSGKDHTLELIIYHDDLQVCNPLGSKAEQHKIDMFYNTLLLILSHKLSMCLFMSFKVSEERLQETAAAYLVDIKERRKLLQVSISHNF